MRTETTNLLARWVSIIGHPFVTTLALVWIVESRADSASAARTVGIVAGLLVLPVALLTARQVRQGEWTTVDASRPHERRILFLVGGAGLLALLAFFARTRPGTPLITGTAGVLVMFGVCAAITPYVKLSLHMATAAVAATILLTRGLPLGWVLAAMMPVLAWSRVALRRHSWSEVVLGGIVGAVAGAIIVRVG